MGSCPTGYCQAVPLSFAEVGVPVKGVAAILIMQRPLRRGAVRRA